MNLFSKVKENIKIIIAALAFVVFAFAINSGLSIVSNFSSLSKPEILANYVEIANKEPNSGKFRATITNNFPNSHWFKSSSWVLNEISTRDDQSIVYMHFESLSLTNFTFEGTTISIQDGISSYGFTSTSPNVDRLALDVLEGEVSDTDNCLVISETFAKNIMEASSIDGYSELVGTSITLNNVDISLTISSVVSDSFIGNDYTSSEAFIFCKYRTLTSIGATESLNILMGSEYYDNFSLFKTLYEWFGLTNNGANYLSFPNNEWLEEEYAYVISFSRDEYVYLSTLYPVLNLAVGVILSLVGDKFHLGKYKYTIFVIALFTYLLSGMIMSFALNHLYIGSFHISARLSVAGVMELLGGLLATAPLLNLDDEDDEEAQYDLSREGGYHFG